MNSSFKNTPANCRKLIQYLGKKNVPEQIIELASKVDTENEKLQYLFDYSGVVLTNFKLDVVIDFLNIKNKFPLLIITDNPSDFNKYDLNNNNVLITKNCNLNNIDYLYDKYEHILIYGFEQMIFNYTNNIFHNIISTTFLVKSHAISDRLIRSYITTKFSTYSTHFNKSILKTLGVRSE